MRNYKVWLLDMDDTLLVGPLSWASVNVFPGIAQQLNRPIDPEAFERGYIRSQNVFSEGGDDTAVAEALFAPLGWPKELIPDAARRFREEYRPALFDDTVAFLDRLASRGYSTYVLSNNSHSSMFAEALRIRSYFKDILTPKGCGLRGKPTPELWEYLKGRTGAVEDETVLVGNNLQTDGKFSENCGLDCIIVDRFGRYSFYNGPCPIVRSLADIPLIT